MTTYAYKDGIMACDSRVTRGQYIDDDDCCKRIVVQGVHFYCTGTEKSQSAIIAYWFGGECEEEDIDGEAFVFDGDLWEIAVDGDKIHKMSVDKDKHYALGSGSPYAITAMDLGCSAVEAVKMAGKRDTCTGGKIRKFKVR